MFSEFKNFIQRGNVLDLAVAVIIGAAFGKIVSSLVDDILMPIIGAIFHYNIKEWGYVLKAAVVGPDGKEIAPALVFGIGKFLQTVIDFILVAFPVFLLVKAAAKAKLSAPPAPPTTTESLLTEIRDLLKK